MSGQPNRYANSAEKFKNQYMDALNLRANVDDFNLQANKNFKATGSLPPSVTQMIDNRTTTEILADTEKLKLNIISELKPIMNSGTASVVVQKIQTAPVNADGSFLVWVAQNIPEIVKSLKRKYAFGIKGDAQDATNIVLFLSDMYSKVKEYTGTVKSYFDSVGESKSGLREGDLDALRKEYETIVARLKTKYPNYKDIRFGQFKVNNLIMKTIEKIQGLFSLITSNEYKSIISDMLDVNSMKELSTVNGKNDLAKLIMELYDSLPSVSIVRVLYKQLDKSLVNNEPELSYSILNEIYNLFPDKSKIENMINAMDVHIIPDASAGKELGETPRFGRDEYGNDTLDPNDQIVTTERLGEIDPDFKLAVANLIDLKLFNDPSIMQEILNSRADPTPYQSALTQLGQDYRRLIEQIDQLNDAMDNISDEYNRLDRRPPSAYRQTTARKSELQRQAQEIGTEIAKLERIGETKREQGQILENKLMRLLTNHAANEQTERNRFNRYYYDENTGVLKNTNPRDDTEKIKKIRKDIEEADSKIEINDKKIESLQSEREKVVSMVDSLETEIEEYKAKNPNKNIDSYLDIKGREYGNLRKQLSSIDLQIQKLSDINSKLADTKNKVETEDNVGSGLKRRRGRPKGSGIAFKDNIDHAKGIQPVKKYHPFGKYFVNSHKLNHGNVLSIRSKSGTNVREYPSKIVSPHMASIVKTIIGGGVPSYNDMEKLTEEEKDYLYKVSKRAEFADKISIPTPSKDKMEKDIHEFEVCKGEIMAGNDSKELIKKFKLLIIKLSKNGTIPKREATEVMQELLELGY